SSRKRPARASSTRSRLVQATTRTSTRSTFPAPTGWISPSCSARNSLACTGKGSSPISSSTSVPPSACAKNPRRACDAPVNAPRPRLERPVGHHRNLLGVERLGQGIVGAALHRLHGHPFRPVGGEQDHR